MNDGPGGGGGCDPCPGYTSLGGADGGYSVPGAPEDGSKGAGGGADGGADGGPVGV